MSCGNKDLPGRLLLGHGRNILARDGEQSDPTHDFGVKANTVLRYVETSVNENVFLQGARIIHDELFVRTHTLVRGKKGIQHFQGEKKKNRRKRCRRRIKDDEAEKKQGRIHGTRCA